MQPQTSSKLDEKSFSRLKRKMKNIAVTSRMKKKNPEYVLPVPEEVGLQLTYRCNLRCAHCFQWNEEGFFHTLNQETVKKDLDFSVVKKVLNETREAKSNLYLWGGEPLVYKHWEELCDLLVEDPRWTVICTNAVAIDKKIDSLLKISENTVLLISLEGFEEANDSIRGKGTYKKIMENLELLFRLKKEGRYKGLISINTVLNDTLIPRLYDFVASFDETLTDSFYISYGWYIPEKMACSMDGFFKENFPFLPRPQGEGSWHSFNYAINPELNEELLKNVDRIMERVWKMRVNFQPPLKREEIVPFVTGEENRELPKKECLSLSCRMDVLPGGEVSACKLFPEFTVGNLSDSSLKEIWQGESYKEIRKTMCRGLSPLCSRCVLLYLHGK